MELSFHGLNFPLGPTLRRFWLGWMALAVRLWRVDGWARLDLHDALLALLGGVGCGVYWNAPCAGCARGGAGGIAVPGDLIGRGACGRAPCWVSEEIICAC
ncbi:hypothetical protein BZL29_2448 [Mycobacterium kansasii]|uniref:Uncharacterized protein n=1 Tax=Mycobacterium kansasii TaxID=1768 RepID=A0A1V3XLY2_MYCKA|nr:hypothetical protein BZL29_2448 [Mycobacterium kansasii]